MPIILDSTSTVRIFVLESSTIAVAISRDSVSFFWSETKNNGIQYAFPTRPVPCRTRLMSSNRLSNIFLKRRVRG